MHDMALLSFILAVAAPHTGELQDSMNRGVRSRLVPLGKSHTSGFARRGQDPTMHVHLYMYIYICVYIYIYI